MAAFTTAILAGSAILGAGSMAYGISEKMDAQSQAQSAAFYNAIAAKKQQEGAKKQTEIAMQQAALSADAAQREYNLNITGAAQSLTAAQQSRDLQQQTIAQENYIQQQKRTAMELDGRRKSMEIVRNQQRARALALTNATAQGASRGSGLQGGYGQLQGVTGYNLLGVSQNLQIGQNIANANQNISGIRSQAADLEYLYATQRADQQTQKAQISYDYASRNAALQSQYAEAGGLISQGQGYYNIGSGISSQAQAQSAYGGAFMQAGAQIFSAGSSLSTLAPSIGQGLGYAAFGTNPFTSFGTTNPYYST